MAKESPYLPHRVINITTSYNLRAVTHSLASSIILPFALQGEKHRAKTSPRNFALYIFTSRCFIGRKGKGHREGRRSESAWERRKPRGMMGWRGRSGMSYGGRLLPDTTHGQGWREM